MVVSGTTFKKKNHDMNIPVTILTQEHTITYAGSASYLFEILILCFIFVKETILIFLNILKFWSLCHLIFI